MPSEHLCTSFCVNICFYSRDIDQGVELYGHLLVFKYYNVDRNILSKRIVKRYLVQENSINKGLGNGCSGSSHL
jgi:hypothetical protein